MWIYFEDGPLDRREDVLPNAMADASCGYTKCIALLDDLSVMLPSAVVYTNFLPALLPQYAWDERVKRHNVYMRDRDGVFTRIDKLTNRELRPLHNIMKMYMSGEFGFGEEENNVRPE